MQCTYRNARERACDCRCPIHHGQPRSIYNNPDCHCLATCPSQPMTLLAPQINGAVFLDAANALWYLPSSEPGHWDWRYATPVDMGHPLFPASTLIADFLRATYTELLPLFYASRTHVAASGRAPARRPALSCYPERSSP
ncbi:hypothetical protein [Micromonospora cremea]|uniref:Uncharacterized protein n=1 Tax=Micromonospora cremea TaxID=709881 RepID=A0A1N5TMI5_9ACTN|nr:hypothetical protein [Micromonospora cremea]SIM49336.1 hypothetical protein SAMN04489832_0252 [Micromonospora cremea]